VDRSCSKVVLQRSLVPMSFFVRTRVDSREPIQQSRNSPVATDVFRSVQYSGWFGQESPLYCATIVSLKRVGGS